MMRTLLLALLVLACLIIVAEQNNKNGTNEKSIGFENRQISRETSIGVKIVCIFKDQDESDILHEVCPFATNL